MSCRMVHLNAVVLLMAVTCVAQEPPSPEGLLLKDFRPQSVYKTPQTTVPKAKFPAIDLGHDAELCIGFCKYLQPA